ncbi:SDR family oxidoreductase [Undibacterium sp.]|uniref:UDP-glucose 4-epimerase family protein n=1 Tax=Undibacterium sp. TaxID=1914977 RepID=UPI0025D7CCD9|nr:SDR family oxidoreductase [Undibacterium sp.]
MNTSKQNASILLTGATGFVGHGLLKQALLQSIDVCCVSRKPMQSISGTGGSMRNIVMPELAPDTDWSTALSDINSVIHCAARVHVMQETSADPISLFRRVNVDATLNLARQAALAGVRQFIFISSVKVNGEQTAPGQPYNEESQPQPEDAYGISKHEAELALLELGRNTGMAITIIRPPLVYGPGVRANFLSLLQSVRRGLPLPLGRIHNKRSFVYLENLVSLVLCCLNNPQAYNQVFLASDDEDLSTTELLQACALALGVRSRLIPFPASVLSYAARLLGKKSMADRLCQSLQVDISKAKQILGWTPPYTVAQGLLATVKNIKTS